MTRNWLSRRATLDALPDTPPRGGRVVATVTHGGNIPRRAKSANELRTRRVRVNPTFERLLFVR
jgi:hypothetical protein